MNELVKSEEASVVCWTMNSLGAWGLRGRGSYSSSGDGALVGPWLDRHRKRRPWGPPQGVSCPRTQHKGGGCLRVFAGDLLPACSPHRCLDSGPLFSPTLRCLTPHPRTVEALSVCGCSEAEPGSWWREGEGEGKAGGGKEERAEAAPRVPTFSGGRQPGVCSRGQRGSQSGFGLSILGTLGRGRC